jgi:hypothetical protein
MRLSAASTLRLTRQSIWRKTLSALKEIDPDYLVPLHCSGEPFFELAKGELGPKVIRGYTGIFVGAHLYDLTAICSAVLTLALAPCQSHLENSWMIDLTGKVAPSTAPALFPSLMKNGGPESCLLLA